MIISTGQNENQNKYGVFSGQKAVTPIMFNPSKEDIKRLTGRELSNDIEYTKVIKDKEARKISLLCKLEVEGYSDMYVNYTFFISKDKCYSERSGKSLCVDQTLSTAWINVPEGANVRDILDGIKANPTKQDVDKNGNPIEVYTCPVTNAEYKSNDKSFMFMLENSFSQPRVAHMGEVTLLNLIFNMSTSIRNTKKLDKFNFHLSDTPEETFKLICDGDNVILNSYLLTSEVQSPAIKYFTVEENGKRVQNKLGVFLFGKVDSKDSTKLHQNVFTPMFDITFTPSTFKVSNKPRVTKFGNESYEMMFAYDDCYSFLSKVLNAEYPFNGVFNKNLQFSEVNANTEVTTTISKMEEEDDDLPF